MGVSVGGTSVFVAVDVKVGDGVSVGVIVAVSVDVGVQVDVGSGVSVSVKVTNGVDVMVDVRLVVGVAVGGATLAWDRLIRKTTMPRQ